MGGRLDGSTPGIKRKMRKHHSWKKFAYKEQHAQVAQEGHGLEERCLLLKEDEHGAQGVMREEGD